jgi:hypothetical protein
MKKTLATFLLIYLLVPATWADEFIVLDFRAVPSDLEARRFEKTDANGQSCALIKVLTDIEGLNFESNLQIVASSYKAGEYRLYVSPGEKRLRIIKSGFIPLEYPIPVRVESSMVYLMEVTSKGKKDITGQQIQLGSFTMKSIPSGATINILGYDDFNNQRYKTPYTLKMPTGAKVVMLTLPRYDTVFDTIVINPANPGEVTLKLKPRKGDLIITEGINARDALIYLNDSLLGKLPLKALRVPEGDYIIKAVKEGYLMMEENRTISISGNKTTQVSIEMTSKKTIRIEVTPANARVILDGVPLQGSSPYSETTFIGTHTIQITLKGYQTIDKTFKTEPDKFYYNFDLIGEKSYLRVESIRGAGASDDIRLLINQKNVGENEGSAYLDPGRYEVEYYRYKNNKTIKKIYVNHPARISPIKVLLPSKWGITWGSAKYSWVTGTQENSILYSNPSWSIVFLKASFYGLSVCPAIIEVIQSSFLPDNPVLFSPCTNLSFQAGGNITRWADITLFAGYSYKVAVTYTEKANKASTRIHVNEFNYGLGLSVYPFHDGWVSFDMKYGKRSSSFDYMIWDGQKENPTTSARESGSFFEIGINILGSVLDGKTLRLWKRPLTEIGSY